MEAYELPAPEADTAHVLGDRLLVRRDPPTDESYGGIVIARNAQRAPYRGTVIALGNGRNRKTGKIEPYEVKVGDRVLFSPNVGEEWQGGSAGGRGDIEWPGLGIVTVLREADIFAVEEAEPGKEAHLMSGRRAGRLRGDSGFRRGAELEA